MQNTEERLKKPGKNSRKNKRREMSPKKLAAALLLLLLFLILFLLAVLVLMGTKGKKEMLDSGEKEITVPNLEDQEIVLEDDGDVVVYNGQRYRYNENITSILCMGIDREGWNEADDGRGSSGQADMLMLAILDVENGTVKLWNISRDSMTEVDKYSSEGNYLGTETMQLCLAYAYGDGKEGSCENTVRSVSRLLYGMPIQSYAVIDLDAIQPLNDAIGGVEVTIYEGDILPSRFVPGTTMLLKGKDVEAYVRSRRTEMPDEPIDSNNNRMERQKQYMFNFIQKALQQTKKDITTPLKLFQMLLDGDNMITNITLSRVSYLASVFGSMNFTEENFQTIPGEVTDGGEYAEYHVDDEALYQMILETFYVR